MVQQLFHQLVNQLGRGNRPIEHKYSISNVVSFKITKITAYRIKISLLSSNITSGMESKDSVRMVIGVVLISICVCVVNY